MCSDREALSRTTAPSPADALAAAMLSLLLAEHPAQLSIEEIGRWVADPLAAVDTDAVHDSLADLVGDGLAHRNGEFVFATRAAVRAQNLRL